MIQGTRVQETETLVAAEREGSEGWDSSAVLRDIATLGTGSLLAAVFNTVLVFLIPRLVGVEDYGYWRLFLLYAGYAGLLHLGFADGALLRWAGRPLDASDGEILPSLRFLIWQHVAVIVPSCIVLGLILPADLRFVGIAVLGFALVVNSATLLQYALQGARVFRPVAVVAAAPSGLLLVFVLTSEIYAAPRYHELIAFYYLAWVLTLAFLWREVGPRRHRGSASAMRLGRAFVMAGWPLVLANIGVGLIQSVDRLAVSWAASIQSFAQYSLAGSAVAVPVMAIQAAYNVFFSHLASVNSERRRNLYRSASRFLLVAWSLLLPYYFALDAFVRHYLPRYVPSLAIARLLLLGIAFVGAVQVLHRSFYYLHGRQGRFLVRTLALLAVGLGLALLAAFALRSLIAVAAAQVVTAGLWWICNEWGLRDLTGQKASDWLKFLGVFGLASLSYWIALRYGHGPVESALLYYGCAGAVLIFGCPRELRLCVGVLTRRCGLASRGWG